MQNIDSLSIFSKILTKENITLVVDNNASTGSFDLRKRVLRIPDWTFDNEHFTKMLVSHECAHAIFTSYDGWIDFIKKHQADASYAAGCLNVVEDCRIDRLIQERYSGLVKTYSMSAKYLIERDFFGIQKDKRDIHKSSFINRLNVYFKTKFYFQNYNIQFTADEQTYVDRIAKIKTWQEVIDITEEIMKKFPREENIKNLDDFSDSVDETEKSKQEEGDGQEGEGQPGNGKGKEKTLSDLLKGGRFNVDEGDKQTGKSQEKKEGQEIFAPGNGFGVETYENLIKNMKDKNNPNVAVSYNVASGTTLLKMPKRFNTQTLSFSTTQMNIGARAKAVVNEYSSWVNLFSSKFEQKKRAREIQKTLFNKSGVLDSNKMCMYQISDDIFRTTVIEDKQQNHAFVCLIDCSSSMMEIFPKVIEQFYAIYAVCAKLGIPFKGYGFTTNESSSSQKIDSPFSSYGGVNIYNFFDTSKNKKYNMNVLEYLVTGKVRMGGTPLSDAIFNMIPIIQEIRDTSQIDILNLVVLTDGGDGSSNVKQYLNLRNNLVKTGLSTRGNFDNTNALYTMLRSLYNVNVTTIDITDHIGGSNLSSNSLESFNKKGQVMVKNHGGTDSCVMIKTSNANSKNREIVNILSNILS